MADKIKLTKSKVEKLAEPGNGRVDYFDSELKGFGVRVSKTRKIYFVLRRVNGKLIRVTIGPTNIYGIDKARREAERIIYELNSGINVNNEKKTLRKRGKNFGEVFEEYLEKKIKLKENTVKTYRKLVKNHLKDWLNIPISEFTKEMIVQKHESITKNCGKATANNSMRTFRAIYNYADAIIEKDLPKNPTNVLNKLDLWHEIEPRKTHIKAGDLNKWFEKLHLYPNPMARDVLLLELFTGIRREEAVSMLWEGVDMNEKTFTAFDTKNGKNHTLPMSDFVFEIFLRRKKDKKNEFVFHGVGKKRFFRDPRKAIEEVSAKSGIKFCNHDLRRTFSTIAEKEVSFVQLKTILNHSLRDDVTKDYIYHDVESLREPMQRISDLILSYCQK